MIDKTRESAPPLIKKIWEFLEEQLEISEKGELRARKTHKSLRFLSPCWEKKYIDKVFYAGNTIFAAFVQDLLSKSINLLLALYLVYPRCFIKMGPAHMFNRGMETLIIDGHLSLILLIDTWEPGGISSTDEVWRTPVGEKGPSESGDLLLRVYCRAKDSASRISLDVEPLLDRGGEKPEDERREEMREMNGGIALLTDLCLAMMSDLLVMIRGLGEVVTCVEGPAVTYAFPDPLVTAYRHSVVHVSLISILEGTALNWCKQENLRARMCETVLFGKVNNPELIVLNFRDQLQCRMGGGPH